MANNDGRCDICGKIVKGFDLEMGLGEDSLCKCGVRVGRCVTCNLNFEDIEAHKDAHKVQDNHRHEILTRLSTVKNSVNTLSEIAATVPELTTQLDQVMKATDALMTMSSGVSRAETFTSSLKETSDAIDTAMNEVEEAVALRVTQLEEQTFRLRKSLEQSKLRLSKVSKSMSFISTEVGSAVATGAADVDDAEVQLKKSTKELKSITKKLQNIEAKIDAKPSKISRLLELVAGYGFKMTKFVSWLARMGINIISVAKRAAVRAACDMIQGATTLLVLFTRFLYFAFYYCAQIALNDLKALAVLLCYLAIFCTFLGLRRTLMWLSRQIAPMAGINPHMKQE